MSEESSTTLVEPIAPVESPPAAPVASAPDDGPRRRMHQVVQMLAGELRREWMAEYLQLRRVGP